MTDTFVQHCISFYDVLVDRSRTQELESGEKVRIFAGRYSDAWRATGISQTYYKPVRNALERHGAILFLQKGSRNADTVIVLKDLPKEDEWQIDGWRDGSGLTKPDESAKLGAELEEIKKLIGGINVAAALAEMEKRLEAVEVELKQIRKSQNKK